jgi:peptidoglycan biosynthesis protein MviN/MurJ (putative lipid II flippase)
MLTRSKAADILRFVIVEGVIKFGIPYALLSVLVQYLMHHKLSHEVLYIAATYPLTGGVIYGLLLWIMPKKLRERPPNKKQALLWAVLAIGLMTFFIMKST